MKSKQTATELEEQINNYFLFCDGQNEGKKDIVKPYTLTGLLCYTGITRQKLEKLLKSRRYSGILERACSRIEAYIEENMLTGALSCNASLNSLKYSFNWGEKPEERSDPEPRYITVTLSPEMSELAR